MRLAVVGKSRGQTPRQAFAVGEYGTFSGAGLCDAAGYHQLERGLEEDDAGVVQLGEGVASGFGFDGSAAEGENKMLGPGVFADGFGLKRAKGRLAALFEELGDGDSGARFDSGVGVEEAPAELLREQRTSGGFAGSHESGKHDAPHLYRQICLGPHALYEIIGPNTTSTVEGYLPVGGAEAVGGAEDGLTLF